MNNKVAAFWLISYFALDAMPWFNRLLPITISIKKNEQREREKRALQYPGQPLISQGH
jgi:hypothetical protein